MGMIGPGMPFGGPQDSHKSVFNVSSFGLNGFPPQPSGDKASAASGTDKVAGDKEAPAGFENRDWDELLQAIMGDTLDFYGLKLVDPLKGMLDAAPTCCESSGFNVQA